MKPVAIDSVRKLVLTVNNDSSSVKFTAFAAGVDGVGWFHLVGDVIDPVPGLGARAAYVKQFIRDRLIDHKEYIHKHGEDMPEIRDWFGKTAPTRRKSRSAPFHNLPQPTHEPDPTA